MSSNNKAEIAGILIKSGANVNSKDIFLKTPLFNAVENNNKEVARVLVEFLISKGADLYAMTEKDGDSPLHYAVMKNNPELVKFLIEHGAYINVKNKKWETPLPVSYTHLTLPTN